MTHLEVRIEDGWLHASAGDAVRDERRRLEPHAETTFEEWAERYRGAHGKPDAPELLLALGQEVFQWLNGDERWVERVREAALPPLIVEFAAPLHPDKLAVQFLGVPWELLGDGGGHLAADPSLLYCPVRRVGEPGEPAPASSYRLSAVFMAAAPRDTTVHLRYEEEEAAILDATGSIGMDLVVEESGTLPLLADCVAQHGQLDVLHLSCHGTLAPEPRLVLEDEEGATCPVGADELSQEIGGNRPRLLCLSACETAASDRVIGSLGLGMIQRGMPAVLGWGGFVRDGEATEFASRLYRHLARHEPLAESVAWARLGLLTPEAGPRGRDWHLARLFLGPQGGGVLCGGKRTRHRQDAEHAYKAFLNEEDQQIRVAGRREFVGRRRQMQDILKVFRSRSHAGVLVHGMGRQGKSSLAARIAHRMADHALVVLHGQYDAPTILKAFARFVGTGEVRDIVNRHMDTVGKDAAALETALRELLEVACSEVAAPEAGRPARRPVLLVVDDFERGLDAPAGGLHRVKTKLAPAIGSVIRAFADADTESRLLFTSRYEFMLPVGDDDLEKQLVPVPLPAMEEYEGKKQARAKLALSGADAGGLDPRLTERVIRVAQGNPGLQDLLFTMGHEEPQGCDQALAAMEAFLAEGAEPDEERLLEFLEKLMLDTLVGLLGKGERELLRASTLFAAPVPLEILAQLAEELSLDAGDPAGRRLFGLGLWEAHEDPVRSGEAACAINALCRPKAGVLSEKERATLAGVVVEGLFELWGGQEGSSARPYSADHELARLALLAGHAGVLAATGQDAVRGLERRFEYRAAADLGRRAIAALDHAGHDAPMGLLRAAGEQCEQTGDVQNARVFFGRAVKLLGDTPEGAAEVEDHAATLVSHARLLAQDGRPDEALRNFEAAQEMLSGPGFRRSRAVTLGYIARIRVDKGEVDEALKLQEERLTVNRGLDDVDGIAAALFDIAQIDIERKDYGPAAERLSESYAIFLGTGRLDGICAVGLDLGQLLCAAGQKEKGIEILTRSRDGFAQLGQQAYADHVAQLIEQIGPDP